MNYSLQRLLIILGLVIIPFYEIFIRVLPFVGSHAPDSRAPKEIIALVFALSIGLLAVLQGTLKPFRNKFLLIIPVYLLISFIMAPYAPLIINNVDSGDFYFWKPFAEVLCFTLMIIAISSIEIDFQEILKVMVICGTIMAAYVILQKFGFDQFWIAKEGGVFESVRAEALGGNMGQPTVVSSWMVMMVPLAIYLKKYWMAALIIVACLLTQGAMVIGALMIIGISYAIKFDKSFALLLIPLVILGSIFIFKHKEQIISRMDGRYQVWSDTINDIKNGQLKGAPHKFPLTGIGLGRFSLAFPMKHGSNFQQAHNDPMEFAYDCGIFSLVLLIMGIFYMFKYTKIWSNLRFSIWMSFVSIFFCSLGSFPFQLGAHQFYSAVLVGLLHNDSLICKDYI